MNRTVFLIGCGGVGSWLLPQIRRMCQGKLVLVDGDVLERKNLDRQLFNESDIGKPKAIALAERYSAEAVPSYFTEGSLSFDPSDVLLVCVDNHAARRAALAAADSDRCFVLIGANETTDAEAYWYERSLRGSRADPRVYYPDILTDASGDPTAPIGCTGHAADAKPQLVTANASAASLMASLFVYHVVHNERKKAERDYWPLRHWTTFARAGTVRLGEQLAAD